MLQLRSHLAKLYYEKLQQGQQPGVVVSEYFEMMLASIEKYLLSDIARQRDMSKIALQSANDRLELNSINRIYKLLNIKVGIYFLG